MRISNKFVLIFLIMIFSCNKNRNLITEKKNTTADDLDASVIIDTASTFNKKEIEGYKNDVINYGDNASFTKLIIYYEDKHNYTELQKFAVIMANKYNNGDGFSQAFVNVVAINNNNEYNDITDFAKINENAKIEALKYLKEGVLLNDIDCMSMLQEIYRNGIGIEKNIKEADNLKEQIAKM